MPSPTLSPALRRTALSLSQLAMLTLMLWLPSAMAQAEGWRSDDSLSFQESLSELREEIRSFTLAHYRGEFPDANVEVSIPHAIPGLEARRCDRDLAFKAPAVLNRSGNALINLRCPTGNAAAMTTGSTSASSSNSNAKSWRIYVPVKVNVSQEVLVAVGPIARDTAITASNTSRRQVNLDAFRDQYVTDLESIAGQVARRTFRDGQVIRLDQLTQPTLVKRGDNVLISARSGSTTVKVFGTALAAGKRGEQIRVRNNSSEQVISAKVAAVGRVEVLM